MTRILMISMDRPINRGLMRGPGIIPILLLTPTIQSLQQRLPVMEFCFKYISIQKHENSNYIKIKLTEILFLSNEHGNTMDCIVIRGLSHFFIFKINIYIYGIQFRKLINKQFTLSCRYHQLLVLVTMETTRLTI